MFLRSLLSCGLLIISLMSNISAAVDVSAGTFSCDPCGHRLCGFADGGSDHIIDPISEGFGLDIAREVEPLSCQEIQSRADSKTLDPELCTVYLSVTLGSDDPCQCEKRLQAFTTFTTGDKCQRHNQQEECQLCPEGKVIGDPEKILPNPVFPVSCENLYQSQQDNLNNGEGGYPDSICRDLKDLFGRHCQCVDFGQEVQQCILQEDIRGHPCSTDSDCCVGYCRYIHDWKSFGKVCTHRADESDQMLSGWTNPVSTPVPTPAVVNDEIDDQAPPLPEGIIGQTPPYPEWDESGFGCFSGSTLVHRQSEVGNTEWVSLDRVEIGDVIEVSKNKFEPIYAFGHLQPDEEGSYIELEFDHEQESLQITRDHLIWTLNKGAMPAGNLKVGQEILLAGGQTTTIVSTQMKTSKGVYAPFTPSGLLVLNHGLMASSYVSLTTFTKLPLMPSAYHHAVAHFFTFPHRFSCYYQSTCPNATYTEEGINLWEVQLLAFIQLSTQVGSLVLLLACAVRIRRSAAKQV